MIGPFTPGQVLTAAQLNSSIPTGIINGTSPDAGELSGTEVIPATRDSGLLQTTTGALAALAQAPIANGTSTDAGALTGAEKVPASRGNGLLQSTIAEIAAYINSLGPANGTVKDAAVATGTNLYDLVSRIYMVTNPQFAGGANWDGVTSDAAVLQAAWNYATTHGVTIYLPPGVCNAGTFRGLFTGSSSGFGFIGAGAGVTILKFADTPPTSGTRSESSLFKLVGTNAAPIKNPRFEGFTIDYSAQTNKGGAALANLALTDVNPYATGSRAISFDQCVGMRIKNVNINELYGDGFIGNRSPFTLIEDCILTNVSGGNPGGSDSFGGAGGLFFCFASRISNCVAFNTRQYQTATVVGGVTVSALNTPCGYIGWWTEFALNVNNTAAFLPPYASNWLTGVTATDLANHSNNDNMGTVIENCFAYGYTIGFKAEAAVPTTISSCTALNCWIPFMGSGSRGRAVNCYADALNLDGGVMPQSGLNFTKALFVHYNANNPESGYAGYTFDGCMSHTSSYKVFVDNCGYGKFLNQQTWVDAKGTLPQLFQTKSSGAVHGLEIRGGHVNIEGGTAPIVSGILDVPGLILDLSVSNNSPYYFQFQVGSFNANSNGAKVSLRTKGLVGLQLLGAAHDCDVDLFLAHPVTTLAMPTGVDLIDIQTSNNRIKAEIQTHSSIATSNNGRSGTGFVLRDSGSRNIWDIVVDIADSGTNTLSSGVISLNSASPKIARATKKTDPYNNPFISFSTLLSCPSIDEAVVLDSGALLSSVTNPPIGPVVIGPRVRAQKLWATALASEPNTPNNLAVGVWYPEGMTIRYLKPSLSGKEGMQITTAGQSAPPWTTGQTVAANAARRSSGNVYTAVAGGVCGATAPTGTTTVSDGTVTWVYAAPFAQFVEFGAYAAAALT